MNSCMSAGIDIVWLVEYSDLCQNLSEPVHCILFSLRVQYIAYWLLLEHHTNYTVQANKIRNI